MHIVPKKHFTTISNNSRTKNTNFVEIISIIDHNGPSGSLINYSLDLIYGLNIWTLLWYSGEYRGT